MVGSSDDVLARRPLMAPYRLTLRVLLPATLFAPTGVGAASASAAAVLGQQRSAAATEDWPPRERASLRLSRLELSDQLSVRIAEEREAPNLRHYAREGSRAPMEWVCQPFIHRQL
jgi:hypothetical protein